MKTCKRCYKEYLPGAGCPCRQDAKEKANRPPGETVCSASSTPRVDAALVDHIPEPHEWSQLYLDLATPARTLENEAEFFRSALALQSESYFQLAGAADMTIQLAESLGKEVEKLRASIAAIHAHAVLGTPGILPAIIAETYHCIPELMQNAQVLPREASAATSCSES